MGRTIQTRPYQSSVNKCGNALTVSIKPQSQHKTNVYAAEQVEALTTQLMAEIDAGDVLGTALLESYGIENVVSRVVVSHTCYDVKQPNCII